jgi:hypothetical protein
VQLKADIKKIGTELALSGSKASAEIYSNMISGALGAVNAIATVSG